MGEHTPTPWAFRDVSGAGLEIYAPVYKMAGVDLPRGMPNGPIHIFQFTAPQIIQIAAERWLQFEPAGWSEMQEANAAYIVKCVNAHEGLVRALTEIANGEFDYVKDTMDRARAALAQEPVDGI